MGGEIYKPYLYINTPGIYIDTRVGYISFNNTKFRGLCFVIEGVLMY